MTPRLAAFALWMIVPLAAAQEPAWTVDAARHEFTMSVTAALNGVPTEADDRLCAFVDADPETACRGLAEAILVGSGANARYLFFVTVYGSSFGETVRFRAYDASLDSVRAITDSLGFSPDAVVGNPSAPHRLSPVGVSTGIEREHAPIRDAIEAVWPNPAAEEFAVRFGSLGGPPGQISVFDVLGREKAAASKRIATGDQSVRFDVGDWPPGLYLVVFSSGDRRDTRTLTVVR